MYCPGEFVNDEQSPRGHGQESVFSWPWTIGVSYMPVGTPPTDHDENLGRAAFRDRFDLVHVGALLGIQFALPGASAGPLFGDASRLSQGGLDLRAAPSDRPGRLRRGWRDGSRRLQNRGPPRGARLVATRGATANLPPAELSLLERDVPGLHEFIVPSLTIPMPGA